ncbi:hypothetical protein BLNAU_2686 [Blattamonas nauphoetae]|uniref:Transcription initiation factor TFIID subunit 8 n=1 Tax=Blattamonas nauphoetae TaxID=2049346 RepID=A0ABQ9YF95_9EUKA|nr:hypothetical protein BLNAU_2686 [Blattamonas nauphoetae]
MDPVTGYNSAVFQRSIAAIAKKHGFTQIGSTPLSCLTQLTQQYMKYLIQTIATLTIEAKRETANIYDTLFAFEQTGLNLEEIMHFLEIKRSAGFFLHRNPQEEVYFYRIGAQPKPSHPRSVLDVPLHEPHPKSIAPYFPCFPPIFTYQHTDSYPFRITDQDDINREKARAKQQIVEATKLINDTLKKKENVQEADYTEDDMYLENENDSNLPTPIHTDEPDNTQDGDQFHHDSQEYMEQGDEFDQLETDLGAGDDMDDLMRNDRDDGLGDVQDDNVIGGWMSDSFFGD